MMLIEMLFVIALAGVILWIGLVLYRAYYKGLQFNLVKNDIVTIRNQLNSYYETLPCDSKGVLQNDLNTDVITELNTVTARAPYIDRYHAFIEVAPITTAHHQPIYHLVVKADINSGYLSLLAYLTERLSGLHVDGRAIQWTHLPNVAKPASQSLLSVMNVSREQFKQLKNNAASAATQQSHAYCFR